nr:DUF3179 domain-containing (seleno)protein [Allomuricauda sp.]
MNRFQFVYYAILLLVIISCKPRNTEVKETPAKTLETIELVAQEWPGQEPKSFHMPVHRGLDKLEFVNREKVTLNDTDLVMGIMLEDTQIALPLLYLEGFEVANLTLNDEYYLVTWCGLVGSAQLFEGTVSGDTLGFDFGRALMNNNLLMVDRKTGSVWNQLSNKSIHGDLKETKLNLRPTLQTTWGYWEERYPDTKVLINKDTIGAAFPSLVFARPYYTTWQPEEGNFHMAQNHQTKNLGMGIELGESSVYFPLEELFKRESPMEYKLADNTIKIHFDQAGLTAWATDSMAILIPSTLAYKWAWKNFYPNTLIFEN